jgi:hypothetical protein
MADQEKEQKPQKLWFKAKTYGWGWTPATWQGWLVLALYLVCVAYYAKDIGTQGWPVLDRFASFSIGLFGLTALLIWVCYKKGEKPRWSWGRKKIDQPKDDQRF